MKVISTDINSEIAVADAKNLLLCGEDSHRNVLKCYGIEEEHNQILIAYELCQANLKQWMTTSEKCFLPACISILEMVFQILFGMKYLHDRNIIHRDLKPENIMLALSGFAGSEIVVKIANFGLCKVILDEVTSMTMTSVSGTPGWMPPEVLHFQEGRNAGSIDAEEKQKMVQNSNLSVSKINPYYFCVFIFFF